MVLVKQPTDHHKIITNMNMTRAYGSIYAFKVRRRNALAFVSMPQYLIDAASRIWKQVGIMRVMGSAHAGVA